MAHLALVRTFPGVDAEVPLQIVVRVQPLAASVETLLPWAHRADGEILKR